MTMARTRDRVAVLVALGSLVGPGTLMAQEGTWVRAAAPAPAPGPAWLGLSYELEWVSADEACTPRVLVESVVQGAPADRAGIRPGDALLSIDGRPLAQNSLQVMGSRLTIGDSVRLRISREGRTTDIVAVADRRPDRPPVLLRAARGDGLGASSAPVITLRADTLVARNLDVAGLRNGGGYWITEAGGRTEYRRLTGFRGDPMDRDVMDLLVCAARSRAAAPPAPAAPAVARVDVRALQARADSVRELLVRRAQAREAVAVRSAEGPARLRVLPAAPSSTPRVMTAAPVVVSGGHGEAHVYSFSVGDHMVAAERGVAGAEVTTLEPELAEYFRGVRDGLLVLRVAPGTPASRAGLRPGDVITAGAGRRLEGVSDLRLLLTLPDPTPVELRIVRQGRSRLLTIRRD